jgi:serine/threonine protein kinase
MSPELILCGFASAAADVFATGAVFYLMLCGYAPFQSASNRLSIAKTLQGDFQRFGSEWDKVSEPAKDLLYRMLEVDPNKRISTADILNHPFILDNYSKHGDHCDPEKT